ncbi:lymphotoxin-alpha isoform X1 [Phyllostomus hastatus]|uniref:lymphotoxin-alpha isoform X1 n=1 Tax=Phyllostomus hastatus TaxID=9423 RepID=UPI001E67EC7A|nr:lymphotoxin-alpha isoform X1 [Phyllostomus hastatus]XP_045682024.1 lymphotoxin-alpha isoform X1 [Phyllostomus hastatus]
MMMALTDSAAWKERNSSLSLSCLRLKQQHLLSPGGFPGPSLGLEPACRLPATAASSIKGPRGLAQQVLLMTPFGHLYLLRVHGAHLLLLLLLGLLLALLPEAQGLPDVGLSAARTAHYHSQKHFEQGTLKPAAHLVGDPSTQNSLRWRANTDRAFLRHGFSLSNNSLLVPTSGLYFVYSQVVFSGEGCFPKATPTPLYLAHEVQLFSSQYPFHVSLLSAQKSVCPGPQGPWVRSVYQGAVFLLTQGDQLSTHTDGISHLLLSPSSVFFGAFAL